MIINILVCHKIYSSNTKRQKKRTHGLRVFGQQCIKETLKTRVVEKNQIKLQRLFGST